MTLSEVEVLPPTTADSMSEKEAAASVIIPWPNDDNKAKYLRLRACGLAQRETLRQLGLAGPTLSTWRKNPKFVALEEDLHNVRKILRDEWIVIEWSRNFAIATLKDGEVMTKSRRTREVKNESTGKMESIPVPLSKQEHEWLMKRSGMYTPQQLAAVDALSRSQSEQSDVFNWQGFMLEMRNTDGSRKIVARELTVELPSMQGADETDS